MASVKRWTSEEEKKLVKMFCDGIDFSTIGNTLNRSSSAIRLRINAIVYANVVKGKSIADIAKQMNTTYENILQMYYVHKDFLKSKGEQVPEIDIGKINTNNKHLNADILAKWEIENKKMEIVINNYKLKQIISKMYTQNKLSKDAKKILNLK